MRLLIRALLKFIVGFLLVGALIFIPAGSLTFVNGWVFIAALFVPMLILGAVLLVRSPELLEKRLKVGENQGTQKGCLP